MQVSAQNIQQYTDIALCCNVNNKKMLGKKGTKREPRCIMGSVVGEQKSLPQLLSFTHFAVTSSVAIAIPEVQVANVIPVCVWKERYK